MIDFTAADALLEAGELEQARKAYLDLATTAEQAGDQPALIRALALTAEAHLRASEWTDAEEQLVAAETIERELDDPTVGAGLRRLRGLLEMRTKRFADAAATYRKLEEDGVALNNHELIFEAVNMQGVALLQAEEAQEALETFQKAVGVAVASNPVWTIPALNNLGIALRLLERHQDALDTMRRLLAAAEKYGQPHHLRLSKLEVACSLADCRYFDLARKGLEEVLEDFRQAGEEHMLPYVQERLDALPQLS